MKEITGHTGLRGIAAMVVVFFHLPADFISKGFATAVVPFLFGHQAVDLFFILSGFILCYIYALPGEASPRGGYWNYHVARFARIYPLHIATVLLMGAMALVVNHQGRTTTDYNLGGFFEQVFLVNGFTTHSWDPPAWSISIEYLAYLVVFPLFLQTRSRPLSSAAALGGIVLLVLMEIGVLLGAFGNASMDQAPDALWVTILRGAIGFVTGCLLHHVFAFHPGTTRLFQRSAAAFAGLTLAVVALAGLGWLSKWWLLLAWPPLVLALTSNAGLTSRVLSTRVALFFGNISYSIYMLHMVFSITLFALLRRRPDLLTTARAQWLGAVFLLFTVLASWLSFRFFEMPVRFWLREKLHRAPVAVK